MSLVCSGPDSPPVGFLGLAQSPFHMGYSNEKGPWKSLCGEERQCGQFGLGSARSCNICLQIHDVHKLVRCFLEFSAPRSPCTSFPTFLQCYFPRDFSNHPPAMLWCLIFLYINAHFLTLWLKYLFLCSLSVSLHPESSLGVNRDLVHLFAADPYSMWHIVDAQ